MRRPSPCSRREVNEMLVVLDEREREILWLRFGLDRGQPAPWTRSASVSA